MSRLNKRDKGRGFIPFVSHNIPLWYIIWGRYDINLSETLLFMFCSFSTLILRLQLDDVITRTKKSYFDYGVDVSEAEQRLMSDSSPPGAPPQLEAPTDGLFLYSHLKAAVSSALSNWSHEFCATKTKLRRLCAHQTYEYNDLFSCSVIQCCWRRTCYKELTLGMSRSDL